MKHLRLAAVLATPFLIWSLSIAQARLAPGEQPGPYHEWFQSQTVPDGTGRSCCAESDGYILSDDQWRIVNGDYQVLVDDEWVVFANTGQGNRGNTILGNVSNPTGRPVAWWLKISGTVYPFCFAPGTLS